MPLVVVLLLVAAVMFLARERGTGGGMTKEERELRRAPDESIDSLQYLENPTPAMKAEFVRRNGSWPGYTKEDFAEWERGAAEFEEMADSLKERYERNAAGRWVPKEGTAPTEAQEEARDTRPSTLRRLPHEVIDLFPFLDEIAEEEKAEYVRRRGSWPGHLAMDEDRLRKVQEAAVDLGRRSAEPDFPYMVSEGKWVMEEDAPAYQDEGLPDFRPKR